MSLKQGSLLVSLILLFTPCGNAINKKTMLSPALWQQKEIFTSPEEMVYDYLFKDGSYNQKIPPMANSTHLNITIDVELELMGVMNVDKDASTVTFKAALRQWWFDPRLKWNPANFSNVERILMSPDDLWVPDTVIREDAGDDYLSDFKMTPIRVFNTGLNYWSRLGQLTTAASLDFTTYPYDFQRINVTIGSWLYTDDRVHYNRRNATNGLVIQNPLNWYIVSPEWEIDKQKS